MNIEESFFIILLTVAVRAGTPLLFSTLGEIFTERSGILNLGIEGIMLIGALSGFKTAHYLQNNISIDANVSLIIAVIVAIISGGLFSLIHAFISVTLKGNQVVSGLSLVILGMGLSAFWGKSMIGEPLKFSIKPFKFPILGDIPILGNIFFNQDILVYISYFLVFICWFILMKTRIGLNIRSTGENPIAVDIMGLNVYKIRYFCVLIGGMFAGIAGAYLSLAYTPVWIEGMTAGRGWICIALVIFSSWNPIGALFGSYLFGGINALQLRLQAIGTNIPASFLQMLPYIFTILVLVLSIIFSKNKIIAPFSLTQSYDRESRT